MSYLKVRPLLLYTMTSGLGDYIIMGDLMRKVEKLVPEAKCLIAHRGNPHVKLWPYDSLHKRFFNVYQPHQILRLILTLKKAKRESYTVFGLQMAPGSVQGFFFHLFLKRIKALDFIVDFNLINADIITPPCGNYILDLHLNQVKELFKIRIPEGFYKLDLPIKIKPIKLKSAYSLKEKNEKIIGIHPWTRLNYRTRIWPTKKWYLLIKYILSYNKNLKIVVFGRDKKFNIFKNYLLHNLDYKLANRVMFFPSNSICEYIYVIKSLDIIVTVSTATVPIGYALNKKLVILGASTLDIWIPKGRNISCLHDKTALFPPSDTLILQRYCPSVENIDIDEVIREVFKFLICTD